MSKRVDIEELVRSQLAEAEIAPSRGAWRSVHRKLRLRKFLKFDPGQVNIYYLGALLVAGSITVALVTPDREPRVPGGPVAEQIVTDPAPQTEATVDTPVTGTIEKGRGTDQSGKNRKMEENASTPSEVSAQMEKAEPEIEDSETGNGERTDAEDTGDGTTHSVHPTLVTYFTPSEVSGCAPLKVSFLNTSVNAVSFYWSFGNGETSGQRSPDYTFKEPGKYRVSLRAFSEDGNSMEYSEEVEVFPAPSAAFEIAPGIPGFDGKSSIEMINYSNGAVSYRWELIPSTGTNSPGWNSEEFQPLLQSERIQAGPARIRMVATSFEGCSDTAVASLEGVSGTDGPDVRFPTAFEGNHTGPSGGSYGPNEIRTDLFHPHFTELPAEYHLQIFTRMGEMIFETRNVYKGWDGYILQERASAGVYLWVAEGKWANGKTFNRKGDVTLLWNDRNWP